MDYIANALLAVITTLQVSTFAFIIKHEKRLSKVEGDLYKDPENPAKLSLSEQIFQLTRKVESLEEKITKICDYINAFLNSQQESNR